MPRYVDLHYKPRSYFLPYHERRERFAVIVAHRRAGKTVACVNDLIKRAITTKREQYRGAYIAPFLNQAKDTAWHYLKHYSMPVLARAPHESELWVELINGARIRIYGADNPDRLRGTYLDDVILDEFADMEASVWGEIVRPMLADRQGAATFIGTPRGKNAFWELYDSALEDGAWYALILPASATQILPDVELEAAKRDMTKEQYEQEFECSFEAAQFIARLASRDEIKFENRVRRYDPVCLLYDPARTTNEASCATGKVAASWRGSRLDVWEASRHFWKPDEIVSDIFRSAERFSPVAIGIEVTGLNQFIEQPLRAAMAARGIVLPLKFLNAPRDQAKEAFILGLQPFFAAHEVTLCGDPVQFKDLVQEILGFPFGKNDIVNALAYVLRIRSGVPVYGEFGNAHVVEAANPRGTLVLALGWDGINATGVLARVGALFVHVVADWVAGSVEEVVHAARMTAGDVNIFYAAPWHFDPADTGMRAQAAAAAKVVLTRGQEPKVGREDMRRKLREVGLEVPRFTVSPRASWVIRAMMGGYEIAEAKGEPTRNVYATLMEGLEAALAAGLARSQEAGYNWQTAKDGSKFISAQVRRMR